MAGDYKTILSGEEIRESDDKVLASQILQRAEFNDNKRLCIGVCV